MLNFIGAGINFDFTEKGIRQLEESERIYAEIYTSPIEEKLVLELEKKVGKKIELIEREKVESNFLVEKAEKEKISLIVMGDPLIATTHISLIIECKKKGIETKIIHNSSILSAAIGKSGLQAYRFGKSATLPHWKKNFEPVSSIEIVEENKKRNLHTILFLDVEGKEGIMNAKEGIERIEEIELKLGRKIIDELIVLSRVGYEDEKISFGYKKDLKKLNLGKPLFIFIIPAKLHIVEKEYLEFFRV
ncbi:MAG: diphthine synthase [Candidatus ainarchaeum sp.]|nr:diphthine synthase [Candidatus ainarchaeum sp.]